MATKVRASEKQMSKLRKRQLQAAKERRAEEEKVSEKRRKIAEARAEQRTKDEDKRRMGRGPADPLAGTSGEGGEFEVIQGRAFHDGVYYGKDEPAGPFLESELPLDELFENKYRRVDGRTRLGRDSRRDKINSNVMDRPLAERIEDEMGLDDEDMEALDEEESEEEEEAPKAKRKKIAKAAKASDDEGEEANPMPEEDEEGEQVDKAARHRKAKRAKMRGRK